MVWYHRTVELAPADGADGGERRILHFGAVDYRTSVWIDGQLMGSHEGGHTPFSFDITDILDQSVETHDIVVRVEDDPLDLAQPRGKQDWQEAPHVIWYHRTTGMWQPVWIETVPSVSIQSIRWTTEIPAGRVTAHIELSRRPDAVVPIRVTLSRSETVLAEIAATTSTDSVVVDATVAEISNPLTRDEFLWGPDSPTLIDAEVHVGDDVVFSYLGVREVGISDGRFLINGRPCFIRGVLEQGYWPASHLAAPSSGALRDEVALIRKLGFNAARLHQKYEDPRFYYWADRFGLLTWAEAPAAYEFSADAMERTIHEWVAAMKRDVSHPSIVAWVPLNESWGVHDIATSSRMQQFACALAQLTRALDGTRPVISNDGWEQIDSDVIGIHDYESDPETLHDRYGSRSRIGSLLDGPGPAGRRILVESHEDGTPVVLSEFGGVTYNPAHNENAWGYSVAATAERFDTVLGEIFGAIHRDSGLAGYFYTQLTDTLQEANGLTTAERTPKLPIERLRQIVTGTADTSDADS